MGRNIVTLLEDFPSIDVNLCSLLEILPRMMPRYYTISTSYKVQPKLMGATVVTEHQKTKSEEFHGLATRYMLNFKKGQEVKVFVKDSAFDLPVGKKLGT